MTDSVLSAPIQPVQLSAPELSDEKLMALAAQVHIWAAEAGFQECGIVDPDLEEDADQLHKWLEKQAVYNPFSR